MRDQQARMSLCAEVVPVGGPRALGRLTYLVPDRLADTLRPGIRVLVPLGRRKVTAVVARNSLGRGGDPLVGAIGHARKQDGAPKCISNDNSRCALAYDFARPAPQRLPFLTTREGPQGPAKGRGL